MRFLILKLLPVIFFLWLSSLQFNTNKPIYTLVMTYGYDEDITTRKGVTFYKKPQKFEQKYPLNSQERVQVEEKIEHEYLLQLSRNSRLEKCFRSGNQLHQQKLKRIKALYLIEGFVTFMFIEFGLLSVFHML